MISYVRARIARRLEEIAWKIDPVAREWERQRLRADEHHEILERNRELQMYADIARARARARVGGESRK